MLPLKGLDEKEQSSIEKENGGVKRNRGLIIQAPHRSDRASRTQRDRRCAPIESGHPERVDVRGRWRPTVAPLRSRPGGPERVPGCGRNGCPSWPEYAVEHASHARRTGTHGVEHASHARRTGTHGIEHASHARPTDTFYPRWNVASAPYPTHSHPLASPPTSSNDEPCFGLPSGQFIGCRPSTRMPRGRTLVERRSSLGGERPETGEGRQEAPPDPVRFSTPPPGGPRP